MTLFDEIQLGESRTLEFKAELPQDSSKWIKTVVAFANGAGGRIIIGVTDSREIVGIPKDTDIFELKDSIADTIDQMCEPQIMFDITAEKIEEAQLLILRVFPCNATPYYIKKQGKKNGTYIRLGATTRNADFTALEELQFRGKRIFYDSIVDTELTITDDDIKFLCDDFSKRAERKITRNDLVNFKLLVGENKDAPTNACALLLGKHDFTSRIQCAQFKGVTRTFFLDKKEYEGPLCSQIDGAYNFVLSHIKMSLEINGIVHKEHFEIPVAAVRELIVNAAVHRNYQMPSSIQVAVYDDRVEVTSPGTLYGSLTIEEAINGHSSLRNPVLAHTLEKIGVIEGWGSGLKRITELCNSYTPGFKHLEIKEFGDMLRFIILRPQSDLGTANSTDIAMSNNDTAMSDKCGMSNKMSDKMSDIDNQRLTIICDYLKTHDYVSNSIAQKLLNIENKTAQRLLIKAEKLSFLKSEGENKGRVYRLNK